MKLIYCCDRMKDAVQSGFITFSPSTIEKDNDSAMYCGGWGFSFCPFCGEILDSETKK